MGPVHLLFLRAGLCLAFPSPPLLVTQEAEMRRTAVELSQEKHFTRTYLKKPTRKKAAGTAQGVGPEFKPQNHKKIKIKTKVKHEKKRKTVKRNKKPK
jgi:hypothetical protein